MQEFREEHIRHQKFAMKLSFWIGFLMLLGKISAYVITGSVAILSDAAESVVHVIAVSFAAYSLSVSFRPADKTHLYGHEKISFFSAGFEGGMIILAAFYIIYSAVNKWIGGLHLQNLGQGTLIVVGAALINGILGFYLIWKGKKYSSIILIANGKHVLADCYTSIGVVVGLGLAMLTKWLPFDPICAIFVALNILWTGGKLMRQSIGGLMDEVDPVVAATLTKILEEKTKEFGILYHGLRHRYTGNTIWVEVHLLFPKGTPIEEAHRIATIIEENVGAALSVPSEIITHLESIEDHNLVHRKTHFEKI